jgi:hypothetical protein
VKKYLLAMAAMLLFASGAQAATSIYTLSSVKYNNSFAPPMINVAACTGCGTATAVEDGFGNIALTGIAWSFSAGGNSYTISFDATTTLAAGTSLIKLAVPTPTCVNGAGTVCTPTNVISGLGNTSLLTGIGSDNITACANNRCRVDVSVVGTDLLIDIRRALSESPTSTNFQTYYLTFAAIPVPAAVWLFGSALGLMGLARRRKTASAGHRRVQHASREG